MAVDPCPLMMRHLHASTLVCEGADGQPSVRAGREATRSCANIGLNLLEAGPYLATRSAGTVTIPLSARAVNVS